MSCKILLVICAVFCIVSSLEAASVRVYHNKVSAVHKLDYEELQENVRGSRQAYEEDASGEDSDEDDDEDDAEQLQQYNVRQQQAQEQAVDDSQEGSDEDDDEEDDDDDDSFFGRRLKRDVAESETTNEIVESSKPIVEAHKEETPLEIAAAATDATTAAYPSAPASPNTSVLILIRDAIKKVTTELPNTQLVATSAQQYFQLFGHFLQQTIEQVIGDDEDEEEVESTTVVPALAASEAEKETETNDKVTELQANDKETATEVPVPAFKPLTIELSPVNAEVIVPEKKPEPIKSSPVDETKA